MKYAACGLLAAFLAMGAYGDIPTTAEGWYTPSGGFSAVSGTGTIYYGYDRDTGQWLSTTVTVDDKGNVTGGNVDFMRDYDLATAYEALVKACNNEAVLANHAEAIETLGENLHGLTSKNGIHIKNENTGQEFTIRFGGSIATAVSGSTGDIPATSDAEDPVDGRSLYWTDESKLELKGWAAQSASGSFWDSFSTPVSIPVRTANGAAMAYRNWYGVDNVSLSRVSSSQKLELNGWADDSVVLGTLGDELTKENGTFRDYSVVIRPARGGQPEYMKIGRLPAGVQMDAMTITTNTADGAVYDGSASLYGWSTADGEASSESPYLPYADGSGYLAWQGFMDFFNSGMFSSDNNGKVVLKATVAEEGKTELMTITQSSSGGSVTSQSVEGKTLDYLTDNASLGAVDVSGDDKIGIKSWDSPEDAKASYTIASRLNLPSADGLDDPTLSPAVVVRDGGVLKYAAMGTIDPVPPPDGFSITTNSADGAVVDGALSLFGIGTAITALEDASDGALIPYVDAASTELQWGGMMEFFADSVFRQSETTGKILLNGTSEEGKVKVLAMTGTGGDDQNVSALTFDSSSIDGVVGGYVQLHGFDTAVSPYTSGDVSFADVLTNTATQITGMSVPVRVPEQGAPAGYAVKYVPMGKITGIPAAAVDNKTIEVNEEDPQNPFLQLHGAAGDGITLEEGDVYMIGSDGKGKFGKQCAADGDDSEVSASGENSLESYTNSEGERFFRIKGWDVNREGTPHLLGWEANEMHYFEADGNGGVETKTTSAGDSVQLAGHDSAGEGAIPYAKKDGNGLGWLAGVDDRVPLLHASSAPTTMALGGSLDKANVSAVPTLNVSGFTSGGNCTTSLNKMLSDPDEGSNRSAHQFMARYSSGGGTPSVHWVGIDGLIQGGSNDVYEAGTGISITDGTNAKEISANLSAGFGISITETAGGGLSISRQGEHDDAGAYSMITFISNIEWDGQTHQLKATKTTVSAKILSGATSTEEVIFTATSHAAEHEDE